jgi:hypothetical protein
VVFVLDRQVGYPKQGEERRGDDDAKAKHDSPARKRSVSGSGEDAA